jgi:hypothetical protein
MDILEESLELPWKSWIELESLKISTKDTLYVALKGKMILSGREY